MASDQAPSPSGSSSGSIDFVEVTNKELQMINSDDEEADGGPPLQYQRLGAAARNILSERTLRSFRMAERFVAMGTDSGTVHVLDFNGNEIKQFNSHLSHVNDVCFDSSYEYLCSGSDDGSVVISSLYASTTEPVAQMLYSCPVTTLALDPKFASAFPMNKNLCVGCIDGQLFINSPGWIRGRRDSPLHGNQGALLCVRWEGPYIAWANDKGVKIYNYRNGQRLGFVRQPRDSRPAPCRLVWDGATLTIAWSNRIKIVAVQRKQDPKGAQEEEVVLLHSFVTDYFICGVTPVGPFLVVLAHPGSEEGGGGDEVAAAAADESAAAGGTAQPELRILSRNNDELTCDVLAMNGYERYGANDYRLEGIVDGLCFICSPKDIISVDLRPWLDWAGSRLSQFNMSAVDTERLWLKVGPGVARQVAQLAFGNFLKDRLVADWLGSSLGEAFWRECASSTERIARTVDAACYQLAKLAGEDPAGPPPQSPLESRVVITEKLLAVLRYHVLRALVEKRVLGDSIHSDVLALLDHARDAFNKRMLLVTTASLGELA